MFVNINVPEDTSLRLAAMISFHGGKILTISARDDDHNSICGVDAVTHAFSVEYDEASKAFEAQRVKSTPHVKLVTPDWLVDSLRAGKLADEAAYHPKYLKNNAELADLVRSLEKGTQND